MHKAAWKSLINLKVGIKYFKTLEIPIWSNEI